MNIEIKFLGIAQDAGIPQLACTCKLCTDIKNGLKKSESPVALGITNKKTGKKFLLEATPELPKQYQNFINIKEKENLSAIILTHAHIGHYTGLMFLGREALNTKKLKVFTTDKMSIFLENNAPWNQLIKLENIEIERIQNLKKIEIDDGLFLTPIEVKHRNEYADTCGFIIEGNEKIFFVPDIDSWEGFEENLISLANECKYLIVDGTFYTKDEISLIRGRDIKEIPHPSVEDTLKLVEKYNLNPNKFIFTHFNHSNRLLHDENLKNSIEKKGFLISKEGMKIFI